MDPSDSAYTYVNSNGNLGVNEAHFQPQNAQSNGLNELNQNIYIADKSELKKILDTVSLLSASEVCGSISTENVEPKFNNKRKISVDCSGSSDSDDIEVVDVVVGGLTNPRKNRGNKLSVITANTSTRMCSNSSNNFADFFNVNESNICEIEVMSEISKKDTSQVSTSVLGDSNASIESAQISTLETHSSSASNTLKEADLKISSPEIYTLKETYETIEIKEDEISSDVVMCEEFVDLSKCSETCTVKNGIETIEIKENEIHSASALCTEIVDISSYPDSCNVKDTIETIEIKENVIPIDSAVCDEIVDLNNCPGTGIVENATIEIKENENPSIGTMLDEIMGLSNYPETCDVKDTVETIEVKENEIPTDNATCDEIVDHSSCNEPCSVKDNVETVESKENDILSDSAMCDEVLDHISETGECSSFGIEYDFNHVPTQITGSWKEFNSGKMNNFTRGCKWAPDGSCILTCSDDNKLRIFNLPAELWNSSQWCDISELEAVLKIAEGDIIYDYCWYPLMNSNDVSSCCLVSTSRKSTVHLWDGYTGELRCSYRSFNHLDELVTPHSLSFDSDGEKLFCGFQNVIRVFDVNRPGRTFEERLIYSHKTGQCGIISCFAFTSADKNVSAAGSYKSTIGLYAEPYGELSCLLEGQANGITQLQFSPDGKYLYSGGRKDPEILCWDLRNLGTVLFSMRRSCVTNQRMYFDISKCGKYVVSGNQNGVITFWDVTKEPKILNEDDFSVLIPIQFFLAHDDCVNGISLHPSYPLLCSSSGQRKFPDLMDDDSDAIFSSEIEKQDNSLRLWWIGKTNK